MYKENYLKNYIFINEKIENYKIFVKCLLEILSFFQKLIKLKDEF